MKPIGTLHPTDDVPVVPENIGIAVISSAAAVVAFDYPSGAHIIHFDAHATFYWHPTSTGVAIPTTSQAGSTSQNQVLRMNSGHETMFQITPGATGYSVTAETTGIIGISFWRR